MTRRVRQLISLVAATAALCAPAAAWGSPDAVIQDCASDGSLDGSYSDADKRAALGRLPADLDEYSDCRSMISAAIGGTGGGNANAAASSNGGPGVVDPKSPAARKAAARRKVRIREARRRQARQKREKELGARSVDPRDGSVFKAANTANGMPVPVALSLVGLGLCALVTALLALWRRNPAFASAVRRVTPARFRR